MRLNFRDSTAAGLILVAVWWGVAILLQSARIVPSPWHVLTQSLPAFALFGGESPSYSGAARVISSHLAATAWRAGCGLFIGGVIGIPVGMAVALPRAFAAQRGLAIWTAALKNLPLFAFIPLFVFWFSNRPSAVVGYVAFATVLVILPGAAAATARGASPVYINLARSAGASRWAIFRHVIVPCTWPQLKPTLRFVVALIWAFSLGAEYAGSPQYGMGVLVYQAYLWSDVGRMLVAAGIYLIAGVATLFVFDLLSAMKTFTHSSVRPEGTVRKGTVYG